MKRSAMISLTLSVVALAMLALVACTPKSPAERVAALRDHYTAKLNGFVVKEEPAPQGAVEGGAVTQGQEEGAGEATKAPAKSAEKAPAATAPAGTEASASDSSVNKNLMLDILVSNDSFKSMPGITLDISMVDASGKEIEHRRLWVDTSKVVVGSPVQISDVLKGVPYKQGDGINVEVRKPIPAAERSEYREFSDAQ